MILILFAENYTLSMGSMLHLDTFCLHMFHTHTVMHFPRIEEDLCRGWPQIEFPKCFTQRCEK